LQVGRAVEAEEAAEAREDLGRAHRRLSQELLDDRPRDQADHAEDEDAHAEQGERRREEPPGDVGAHA